MVNWCKNSSTTALNQWQPFFNTTAAAATTTTTKHRDISHYKQSNNTKLQTHLQFLHIQTNSALKTQTFKAKDGA